MHELQRRMTFPSDFSRTGTASTWSHVEQATAGATDQEEAVLAKAHFPTALEDECNRFQKSPFRKSIRFFNSTLSSI